MPELTRENGGGGGNRTRVHNTSPAPEASESVDSVAAKPSATRPRRWYYAESSDAERWSFGGMSREVAIAAARSDLEILQLPSFFIAHEEPEQQDDALFWKAVAAAICGRLEEVDEELAEENWIDPEDGWITDRDEKMLTAALAAWLPSTGLERPGWRTIAGIEELLFDCQPVPEESSDADV